MRYSASCDSVISVLDKHKIDGFISQRITWMHFGGWKRKDVTEVVCCIWNICSVALQCGYFLVQKKVFCFTPRFSSSNMLTLKPSFCCYENFPLGGAICSSLRLPGLAACLPIAKAALFLAQAVVPACSAQSSPSPAPVRSAGLQAHFELVFQVTVVRLIILFPFALSGGFG